MTDINYFEIIQNKLDALVEKIIQKENSDEDFRITYAQILEKINTKMDVFSNTDNGQHISAVADELIALIKERQEVVDAKFNAVKGEFDNLNDILENSLKTTELVSAFNKIQNQIQYFSEEQENQKFAFNSIVSHIEKFGTLEDTNNALDSHFSVVKEQNTTLNDNLNDCIETIRKINESVESHNQDTIDSLANILLALKEFSTAISSDFNSVNESISDAFDNKIVSINNVITETSNSIDVLNANVTTLLKAVDCIYEYEPFQSVKNNVAEVVAKTSAVSELVKKIATKDELIANSLANKDELKNYTKELVVELEKKLLTNLDFSALEDIKGYTEKMFFQGTEVLKEEMWSIKDSFATFNKNALMQEDFKRTIDELKTFADNNKNDLTDIISEESVATSNQLNEISLTIKDLKDAISNIILNEQNEQINTALHNLQSKFVTQLVQIADNISFAEEADDLHDNIVNCTEELKDKISADIADIKNDISLLRGAADLENEKITDILNNIDNSIKTDVTSDLKAIISSLKLLTSGLLDEQDHVYTMPDVENDLANIRVELDKIKKSILSTDSDDTQNLESKLNEIGVALSKLEHDDAIQDIAEIKAVFNSINEDIASISKRTNRLILASDEVAKSLKSNISAFSMLLGSFERQSREFYNSAFMLDLNDKLENLSRMTTSLVGSNQAINEAFMYIGEWIDSTSDSFDELKSDVVKIKKGLLSDELGIAEKLEYTVNSLSQRIEIQDAKMDAIDEKLNKLAVQMQDTKELKSLVEYVSSQISLTNEKMSENDKLFKKIDSMDKQLKNLEKSVSAIVDYLEDDMID